MVVFEISWSWTCEVRALPKAIFSMIKRFFAAPSPDSSVEAQVGWSDEFKFRWSGFFRSKRIYYRKELKERGLKLRPTHQEVSSAASNDCWLEKPLADHVESEINFEMNLENKQHKRTKWIFAAAMAALN